ncbi:MAG: AI-2E family transporter [candidate division KSB1 bacterium]|nr:AI-2E family transporter [candidate division KSB1 bacterium]MDZ7368966.1 AI-2E family transporter [candidate division KSB1 bacterium]MDZ7406996.1 AI-2E family transporter [candidate division KSB1 bacterium]
MQSTHRQYHVQFSDRHFIQVRRVFIAILLAAATITLTVLLRDLVTPVVISIFLAYLLAPLVDAIENRGLSRTLAVIMVFAALMLVFTVAISLVWQDMLDEIKKILAGLKIDNREELVEGVRAKLRAAFPGMAQSAFLDEAAEKAVAYGESFASRTVEAFSAIGEAIIIPFLTFFILKDARTLKKNIVALIPNRYFEMSLSLIHKATLQLGRFIRGQLLDAAVVGMMAMIALSFLELPYALLIGAFAGMCNLIPFLGPILGCIAAIVVSIIETGSFEFVLKIIIAFAVVKLIDDLIVQPTVVSKSVELHPVTVIISIFAGGHVAGILGMVVAVPLVSIAKVTASILYWGFTKYYIFGPPAYAVDEPQTMVEVLPATAKIELPASTSTPPHPAAAENKKMTGAAQTAASVHRARQAKKN